MEPRHVVDVNGSGTQIKVASRVCHVASRFHQDDQQRETRWGCVGVTGVDRFRGNRFKLRSDDRPSRPIRRILPMAVEAARLYREAHHAELFDGYFAASSSSSAQVLRADILWSAFGHAQSNSRSRRVILPNPAPLAVRGKDIPKPRYRRPCPPGSRGDAHQAGPDVER